MKNRDSLWLLIAPEHCEKSAIISRMGAFFLILFFSFFLLLLPVGRVNGLFGGPLSPWLNGHRINTSILGITTPASPWESYIGLLPCKLVTALLPYIPSCPFAVVNPTAARSLGASSLADLSLILLLDSLFFSLSISSARTTIDHLVISTGFEDRYY